MGYYITEHRMRAAEFDVLAGESLWQYIILHKFSEFQTGVQHHSLTASNQAIVLIQNALPEFHN